jgi:hypothetical protein
MTRSGITGIAQHRWTKDEGAAALALLDEDPLHHRPSTIAPGGT